MTKTAEQIATIAEQLTPEAQRALLDVAESLAQSAGFYETMSAEQITVLEQSLAEAATGKLTDQQTLDAELDALFAKSA